MIKRLAHRNANVQLYTLEVSNFVLAYMSVCSISDDMADLYHVAW